MQITKTHERYYIERMFKRPSWMSDQEHSVSIHDLIPKVDSGIVTIHRSSRGNLHPGKVMDASSLLLISRMLNVLRYARKSGGVRAMLERVVSYADCGKPPQERLAKKILAAHNFGIGIA